MASVEKKQILENAPGYVVAGLMMGGPAGAIVAAGATAFAATIQEQADQELRQKEWERTHPDPVKVYEKRKELEAQARKTNDAWQAIRSLMQLDEETGEREKYTLYNQLKIHCDPYRNDRRNFNSRGTCYLAPDRNKYVLVSICEKDRYRMAIQNYNYILKDKNGVLLSVIDFKNKLLKDFNNHNIERYVVRGSYNDLPNECRARIQYMYTIDGGNNFNVCLY